MEWLFKIFSELTVLELYEILSLRSEVFVVEQNCVYQDMDFKDQKAVHLLGKQGRKSLAYCRLFAPGDYFSEAAIGRIVTAPEIRKTGQGRTLMLESIKYLQGEFPDSDIAISAQRYLKSFYESLGFKETGAPYLEDGIPHIKMIKSS